MVDQISVTAASIMVLFYISFRIPPRPRS